MSTSRWKISDTRHRHGCNRPMDRKLDWMKRPSSHFVLVLIRLVRANVSPALDAFPMTRVFASAGFVESCSFAELCSFSSRRERLMKVQGDWLDWLLMAYSDLVDNQRSLHQSSVDGSYRNIFVVPPLLNSVPVLGFNIDSLAFHWSVLCSNPFVFLRHRVSAHSSHLCRFYQVTFVRVHDDS